jgi:hypothetical protein
MTKGVWLTIAMVTVLVLAVGFEIFNQNVSNTASDWTRYGQLNVPDSGVFTLPTGSFDLILENDIDTGLRIPPHLAVTVTPTGTSTGPAVITRNVGQQFGGGSYGSTQDLKRVWRVQIHRGGKYRVTVSGAGPDSPDMLDLGDSPPVGSFTIWIWAGLAELALLAAWQIKRLTAWIGARSRPVGA